MIAINCSRLAPLSFTSGGQLRVLNRGEDNGETLRTLIS
jgi:hypothetical protein